MTNKNREAAEALAQIALEIERNMKASIGKCVAHSLPVPGTEGPEDVARARTGVIQTMFVLGTYEGLAAGLRDRIMLDCAAKGLDTPTLEKLEQSVNDARKIGVDCVMKATQSK